jgi:hypothetical protein
MRLFAACRCLPGLRTIIIETSKLSENWNNLEDPVTEGAVHLLGLESRIEWITWLGIIRPENLRSDALYLRKCKELRREKGSEMIFYVHRLVNAYPELTVRKPGTEHEITW